jgi:hypothetical protein
MCAVLEGFGEIEVVMFSVIIMFIGPATTLLVLLLVPYRTIEDHY